MNIKIKLATKKDLKFFYLLRNDKKNRKNFFNSKKISYSEHTRWYLDKIKKKNFKFFKIVFDNKDVGYLRFEFLNRVAFVSICVTSKFSGKGIGRNALILCEKKIDNKILLISKVKKSNTGSIKMFYYAKHKNLFTTKNFILFFKLV